MGPGYREAREVTSAEVSRNFGAWQDRAMEGPVIVTRHGRPRVVILSASDYAHTKQQSLNGGGAESEPQLEVARAAILNHMSQGFASFDADLRFTSVNRIYEDFANSSATQLIGRRFEECFPTASPILVDHLRRTLRTGEPAEFESRSTTFPDRVHHAQTFPYPGGLALLINSRVEEEERKAQLLEAQAFRSALEATMPLALGVLNVRGGFVRMNPAFCDLTGFSREDLVGVRLTDLVRPAQRHAALKAIDDTLQGGAAVAFDTTILAKGAAERPVRIGMAAIIRESAYEGLSIVAVA